MQCFSIKIETSVEYTPAYLTEVIERYSHRSDMDCFVPLMEKFKKYYGFYPKYPIADAGYGSLNNYIYCQEHGMEKYMKFTMYKKETKDKEYRENPFRAVNFKTNGDGNLICPNNKKLIFAYIYSVLNFCIYVEYRDSK